MAQRRSEVLRLYRRILDVARTWTATVAEETGPERDYIRHEAGRLFKQNKNVSDPKEVDALIKEGDSRLQLALHYNNPYPRMPHAAPGGVSKQKRKQRRQERLRQQSIPSYMKSYQQQQQQQQRGTDNRDSSSPSSSS